MPLAAPSSSRRMPRRAARWRRRWTTNRVRVGRRQRAEAVDDLGLEIVQPLAVRGAGHALVELQPQVHVGDVILRQQGRELQVDFAAARDGRVERRIAALAQCRHGALEQLEVEAEPDLLDLAALFLAEQFAGAAYLEVLGRKREARAEVFQRLDRLEPLARVVGQRRHGRREQVGKGAVMGAPDAPAQLVQLREPETVGAVDQDGVGRRHVDAGLDDGRADQDLEAPVVEIEHQLLELALAHLAVADADRRFRHQAAKPLRETPRCPRPRCARSRPGRRGGSRAGRPRAPGRRSIRRRRSRWRRAPPAASSSATGRAGRRAPC